MFWLLLLVAVSWFALDCAAHRATVDLRRMLADRAQPSPIPRVARELPLVDQIRSAIERSDLAATSKDDPS